MDVLTYLPRQESAESGVINATQKKKAGGVSAVVYPFSVADTTTMERPSVYPYDEKEAPGINIHRLRNELGWSQRKLGEHCQPSLDHTIIRRLEKNEGFTQDTLERVAKALGVKRYQDLLLPPELFDYSKLPQDAKERIATAVSDASIAAKYKTRQAG